MSPPTNRTFSPEHTQLEAKTRENMKDSRFTAEYQDKFGILTEGARKKMIHNNLKSIGRYLTYLSGALICFQAIIKLG
jgi:hypothetical protein